MVLYATFGRRFAGFVLDGAFDLFVLLVLRGVGVGEWFGELWGAWLLLHHVGFVMEGGTLGHRVLGLRIVRVDGERVGIVHAVVRAILKVSGLVPLGLGFLWMLDERQRRTWHDLGAGTIVVRECGAVAPLAPDWADAPPWMPERQREEPSLSTPTPASTDSTAV